MLFVCISVMFHVCCPYVSICPFVFFPSLPRTNSLVALCLVGLHLFCHFAKVFLVFLSFPCNSVHLVWFLLDGLLSEVFVLCLFWVFCLLCAISVSFLVLCLSQFLLNDNDHHCRHHHHCILQYYRLFLVAIGASIAGFQHFKT